MSVGDISSTVPTASVWDRRDRNGRGEVFTAASRSIAPPPIRFVRAITEKKIRHGKKTVAREIMANYRRKERKGKWQGPSSDRNRV